MSHPALLGGKIGKSAQSEENAQAVNSDTDETVIGDLGAYRENAASRDRDGDYQVDTYGSFSDAGSDTKPSRQQLDVEDVDGGTRSCTAAEGAAGFRDCRNW